MDVFLAIFFSSVFFIYSGFIFSFFNGNKVNFIPTAVERISGFSFCALLSFLSLVFFHHILWGAYLAVLVTIFFMLLLYNQNRFVFSVKIKISQFHTLWIKFLFLGCIGFVFQGFIFTKGSYYEFPNITGLAEHIFSIVSVYNATKWPTPNPYLPHLNFSYNILFYIPLGVIAKLTKSADSFYPIFAVALIWSAWNLMSLIENTLEALDVPRNYYFVGIIFISFCAGFTGLFLSADFNDVTSLALITKTHLKAYDPFFFYAFMPQHLLSTLCIIAAWIVFNYKISLLERVFWQNTLFIASCLSSYMLIPITLMVFLTFFILNFYEFLKNKQSFYFLFINLFFIATILFFLYSDKIGNNIGVIVKWPATTDGWQYLILEMGVILVYFVLGLRVFLKRTNRRVYFSYLILFFCALPFLFFMNSSPFADQIILYLRIIITPIACIGFVFIVSQLLKRQIVLFIFMCIIPIIFSIFSSLITISYLVSLSFVKMPDEKINLVNSVRQLPSNIYFYFPSNNISYAALMGHLAYLDIFIMRNDGFLYTAEKELGEQFIAALNSNKKNLKLLFNYPIELYEISK